MIEVPDQEEPQTEDTRAQHRGGTLRRTHTALG